MGWEVAVFCHSLHLRHLLRFNQKGYKHVNLQPARFVTAVGARPPDHRKAIGHVLQNLLTVVQRLTDLEKPGAPGRVSSNSRPSHNPVRPLQRRLIAEGGWRCDGWVRKGQKTEY